MSLEIHLRGNQTTPKEETVSKHQHYNLGCRVCESHVTQLQRLKSTLGTQQAALATLCLSAAAAHKTGTLTSGVIPPSVRQGHKGAKEGVSAPCFIYTLGLLVIIGKAPQTNSGATVAMRGKTALTQQSNHADAQRRQLLQVCPAQMSSAHGTARTYYFARDVCLYTSGILHRGTNCGPLRMSVELGNLR